MYLLRVWLSQEGIQRVGRPYLDVMPKNAIEVGEEVLVVRPLRQTIVGRWFLVLVRNDIDHIEAIMAA